MLSSTDTHDFNPNAQGDGLIHDIDYHNVSIFGTKVISPFQTLMPTRVSNFFVQQIYCPFLSTKYRRRCTNKQKAAHCKNKT